MLEDGRWLEFVLSFPQRTFLPPKKEEKLTIKSQLPVRLLEFVSPCDYLSSVRSGYKRNLDESNLFFFFSSSLPVLQAQCCPQSQSEASLLPFGGFIPFCLLVLLFTTLLRLSFMPHLQRTRIIRRVNGFFEMLHYC